MNIEFLTIKPNHTSFGSLNFKIHEYVDYKGKIRTSQCTTGKRSDLNLDNTADIIVNRFKNFDKVRIMPMNVSDGTEAYLIANSIIKKVGFDEFVKRFSPISASDVYAPIIKSYPAKGIVFLHKEENELFCNKPHKLLRQVNAKNYYSSIINPIDIQDKKLFKLTPKFRECFNFQIIDLQKRLKLFKDEGNSVVIIRNCLYHSFGENESVQLVKKLANKLKTGSLFIIGGFDRAKMPNKFMTTVNQYFYEIENNVFTRKTNNSKFLQKDLLKIIQNNIK